MYATVPGLTLIADPVASVMAFGDWVYPMWKHAGDLYRYRMLIDWARVDCVVETGTHNGASAEWFARQPGVKRVITVDVRNQRPALAYTADGIGKSAVFALPGSSTDPTVLHQVRGLIGECQRVMVSLDSDHSRAHVAREIELYGPLVSPGCPLVVEDGVIPWLPADVAAQHGVLDLYDGNVLEAIGDALAAGHLDAFHRHLSCEALQRPTMAPYGWWVKDR